MKRLFVVIFICFSIIIFSTKVFAASSKDIEALKVIGDFAERLCNEVPLEGHGQSIELSGKAKAELKGMISKLAKLGLEGAGKYHGSNYQGLLQSDLAAALKNNTDCKREIWKDLKEKFLGRNNHTDKFDLAVQVVDNWYSAIYEGNDQIVRRLMILPIKFDKVERYSVEQVRQSFFGFIRDMKSDPEETIRLEFGVPMTASEKFYDLDIPLNQKLANSNLTVGEYIFQQNGANENDIVVPFEIKSGGKGMIWIYVRPNKLDSKVVSFTSFDLKD